MKPTLQFNISQQLTLTPQLQQAIRLLQLSSQELQQEIQQLVESNPLLETLPEDTEEHANKKNEVPPEEYTEYQWSELYSGSKKNMSFDDEDINPEHYYSTTEDLRSQLMWQLDLSPMSDTDRLIATNIIDAIDDDGFLNLTLKDIQASIHLEQNNVELDEIEAVRHRLQRFEPVGCACINLSESLCVQLEQLPAETVHLELAIKIVQNDIGLLGQHNYRQILKNYQISEQTLQSILDLIHRLNPRPGNQVQKNNTEYIIPDLIAKKINEKWSVTLNPATLPKLRINQHYASMIQRANNTADNQYLKNNLQEARWLLKSLQSRQETLLKVAHCVVEYQQDFLEQGEEAMKPLILNEVALALEMHESTISRVTTQKYIHTPRGVFELKYFFSSHVNTVTGGECSSTAIRALIKKLILAESGQKPLSDSKIAQLMKNQGIQVARRTVAKYREAMGIAPSNERKKIRN